MLRPERIQWILDWGQRHNWPEVVLDDENVIPAGRRNWIAAVRYFQTPQRIPIRETDRLRSGQLALLRIGELADQEQLARC